MGEAEERIVQTEKDVTALQQKAGQLEDTVETLKTQCAGGNPHPYSGHWEGAQGRTGEPEPALVTQNDCHKAS